MPTIAVFGSSAITSGDPEYEQAVRLGKLLARAGHTVANGGYGGAMEAVSSGARSIGGEVIGVTAPLVFPSRDGLNHHVTQETTTETIAERIHRLVDTADACITLPGSIGTVTELMVAWNTAFVAQFRDAVPIPVVTVGEDLRSLVEFVVERFATSADFVTCVETVEAAADTIEAFFDNPRSPAAAG